MSIWRARKHVLRIQYFLDIVQQHFEIPQVSRSAGNIFSYYNNLKGVCQEIHTAWTTGSIKSWQSSSLQPAMYFIQKLCGIFRENCLRIIWGTSHLGRSLPGLVWLTVFSCIGRDLSIMSGQVGRSQQERPDCTSAMPRLFLGYMQMGRKCCGISGTENPQDFRK